MEDKLVFVCFNAGDGYILYKNGKSIMCRENFRDEDWIDVLGVERRFISRDYGYPTYELELDKLGAFE